MRMNYMGKSHKHNWSETTSKIVRNIIYMKFKTGKAIYAGRGRNSGYFGGRCDEQRI